MAKGLLALPPRAVDAAVRPLPARYRPQLPSVKLAKFAAIARLNDPAAMYATLVTHWNQSENVVVGARSVDTLVDHAEQWPQVGGLENLLMALDTCTYLPDDILVKLDRATMAVGLEGRSPFLDHPLVEFAARLPSHLKRHRGRGKAVLRRAVEDLLPRPVLTRSKKGFGVPISVDTYKPEIMQEALDLGADIINDIWALQRPGALDVVASHASCGVCIMHMHGEPQTMQRSPMQGDAVPQVLLSGNHAAIQRWRTKQALGRTWQRRPDMLEKLQLTKEQQKLLDEFVAESEAKRAERDSQ